VCADIGLLKYLVYLLLYSIKRVEAGVPSGFKEA
jgi:hypothetical protein